MAIHLLMGEELGDEIYIDVPLVSFSIVSTNFHLHREHRYLYEFSVEKLVLWVFADISAISSRVGEKIRTFQILFFFACHCAVVSPSSVQVLTRLSGGARPFGSLIRFWLAHVRRELSLFTQACNGCIAATVSSNSSDRYTYPRYDKLYRYYYAYANRRHTTWYQVPVSNTVSLAGVEARVLVVEVQVAVIRIRPFLRVNPLKGERASPQCRPIWCDLVSHGPSSLQNIK